MGVLAPYLQRLDDESIPYTRPTMSRPVAGAPKCVAVRCIKPTSAAGLACVRGMSISAIPRTSTHRSTRCDTDQAYPAGQAWDVCCSKGNVGAGCCLVLVFSQASTRG